MSNLTQKELTKWVEAVLEDKVDGKEIDSELSKELEELGKRKVTLEEATVIASVINEYTNKEMLAVFNSVWNSIDLLQVLLKDELGITDEQAEKAKEKVKKKQKEFLEKKRKEQEQKQKEESKKQSGNSEKVVEMKPKND
nr:MAG TPA: hypothetical protein [Herelleviridae sp.]